MTETEQVEGRSPLEEGAAPAGEHAAPGAGRRWFGELDVLRGAAILGMLAVNFASPGLHEAVPQLGHAPWHGFTFADWVFPAFLFVVGTTLGVAGKPPTPRRIARRTLLLFAIGLLLNAVPAFDLGELRVMGVLQRIALAYAGAAVVVRLGGPWAWALSGAALLLAHWAALLFVPLPDGTTGSLEQTEGLAAWVDAAVLGDDHSYFGAFPDPEGLLGTIPAVGTVLLGALAGRSLRAGRVWWLVAGGVVGLAAGLVWSTQLPLNKQLWTGSYVLVTAGISALVLVVLHLVERARATHLAVLPVGALGRNALTVYVVAEVPRRIMRESGPDGVSAWERLIAWTAEAAGDPLLGGLLLIGLVVAVCWAVASLLAWRGVRLRV
ncbi:MAG: DUF1624 domain-containing protein [Actinobacteria bacterium]|nr:DUF1624 domain-containing protein [Actinomycetota bacterium]